MLRMYVPAKSAQGNCLGILRTCGGLPFVGFPVYFSIGCSHQCAHKVLAGTALPLYWHFPKRLFPACLCESRSSPGDCAFAIHECCNMMGLVIQGRGYEFADIIIYRLRAAFN